MCFEIVADCPCIIVIFQFEWINCTTNPDAVFKLIENLKSDELNILRL